ncbi:GyrI-like domain-containing protein [Tenacibaculum ovolyticum]|uniref:GyrI-like domain-containing protein n=1 Tax=Tenacibaculum ovolyticum TaxID=104270 RepID=UPI000429FD6C|nr:GyrI-like domain-containing protein [Tenacibaculum ovolyticum]
MNTLKKEGFYVVGISIRTTNENGQAMQDIPKLWQQFMSDDLIGKVTNRLEDSTYAVYTDYESDHTKPYTMILGYKVSDIDNVPLGFVGKRIEAANYQKYVAKGDLTKNAVVDEWMKIWESDIKRAYTSDFEVYGEKAQNPTNGEAEIYINVK